MRLTLSLALLAAACVANAAHASPGARPAMSRQAIHALILRADADSLAAAAALSYRRGMSPSALDLAVSAGELAPQNPVIGWLHLELCVATPSCDFRDVATVLRWIDADNGASWLPLLAAAYRARDWTEVDRVIADMAQTKRFDVYWNPLIVLLADAIDKARRDLPRGHAVSDAERFDLASRIAGELLPSFATLVVSCRNAGARTERREACLKLSHIMQHGDAIATQMAGFRIESRLVARGSKEGHALDERRRSLQSRVAAAARADSSLPRLRNARARRRLAQMRARPRQEEVEELPP